MPIMKTMCRRPPATGANPNPDPSVDQGQHFGWFVTWNPDDGRFYVSEADDGVATATFKDWRNARQYCRTHSREVVA